MDISLYIDSDSRDDALEYAEKILSNLGEFFEKPKLDNIEAYWKMKGVYLIEYRAEHNKAVQNPMEWISCLEKVGEGWDLVSAEPDLNIPSDYLLSKNDDSSRIFYDKLNLFVIAIY